MRWPASTDKVKSIGLWLLPGLLFLFSPFPVTLRAMPAQVDLVAKLAVGHSIDEANILPSVQGSEMAFPEARDPALRGIFKLKFSGNADELSSLQSSGIFAYVQPDAVVRAAAILTSDPKFTSSDMEPDKEWWLAKIKAPDAWEISHGSKDVTVAIIDTGINGFHEDLNDGRVGAGFLSYCQVFGPNGSLCLIHQSGRIMASENSDDNGHGTIVAGIIGAISNNNKGIAGINWQVRMLPVKVLDSDGTGVSSDVAAGIIWAVDNGAKVINMSLGGTSLEGNAVLNDAIRYAFDRDVLIVAAAGNDSSLQGSDLDVDRVFPVCSDNDKNMVLGVAATDMNDHKAGFSNYGRVCIDISAPGTTTFTDRDNQKGVISTYFDPTQPAKNNLYVLASGTSMSAPMVSGVAALLKSAHPDLSALALRDRIIGSADNIDTLNPAQCKGASCTGRLGSGRLNALRALQASTIVADSVIQGPSGRMYLIEDGLKRPISDFVFAQRSYKKDAVKLVTTTEEENLPTGQPVPPLDGTLVMGAESPLVYLVARGVLQPLSYLAFVSNGFDFSKINSLPEIEVGAYRKGPNFTPANGALFKPAGEPAVYFMHEGRRRLISAFVFGNRKFDFSKVVEIGQDEMSRYPQDALTFLEPPLDGTLVKGDAEAAIYVFEDGRKRPLSARAFSVRGYQFSQVKLLPQSEINGYVTGDVID